MLSSYVSFTCVAVEPGLFSAYWILSYETPETKPLRPVAGIDRTVSSMHQRVQQTSIMHGMDTLFDLERYGFIKIQNLLVAF